MHSMLDLYKALSQLAVTVADNRPLQVENAPFAPPAEGLWFRAHIMPAETEVFTLGMQGWDRTVGLLQIDIMAPVASGTGETLLEYDKMYQRARQWHGPVLVTSCSRAPGFVSNGWHCTPVTFTWRAVTRKV